MHSVSQCVCVCMFFSFGGFGCLAPHMWTLTCPLTTVYTPLMKLKGTSLQMSPPLLHHLLLTVSQSDICRFCQLVRGQWGQTKPKSMGNFDLAVTQSFLQTPSKIPPATWCGGKFSGFFLYRTDITSPIIVSAAAPCSFCFVVTTVPLPKLSLGVYWCLWLLGGLTFFQNCSTVLKRSHIALNEQSGVVLWMLLLLG